MPFTFTFDAKPIQAYPGETIAAALLAAGIRTLRRTEKSGAPLEAAQAGASVTVIDEYSKAGGQYFRQPQARFGQVNEAVLGKSLAAGRALIAKVASEANISLRTGTLVWGVFDEGVLEIERDNRCERLVSKRLIVATGAYERPIPFPGWTLPGVSTAGAAQTLLKSQFVLPGRRMLMSGTGPFQLPVSTQLLKAGAEIVEILEALPARDFFRRFAQPWRHLDKLREAQGYFLTLLSRRVPLRFGQAVIEARGDGRVEEAVVAPLDAHGHPLAKGRRTVAADSVLVNYGFIPSLQIPRLLGCDTRWDEAGACWVVSCGEDQRSSVPAVFVAGEITGIAGHRVAVAEGRIAGLNAAADLGLLDAAALPERQPRRERARHQSFADHLKTNFAPREGLYDMVTPDTVVCRCEEAAAASIQALAAEWNGSLRAIKQCSRAGMSQCQSRICEAAVVRLAARAAQLAPGSIGRGVRSAVRACPATAGERCRGSGPRDPRPPPGEIVDGGAADDPASDDHDVGRFSSRHHFALSKRTRLRSCRDQNEWHTSFTAGRLDAREGREIGVAAPGAGAAVHALQH